MRTDRRRLLLFTLAGLFAAGLGLVLATSFRAQRTLGRAAREAHDAELLPFTLGPLDPDGLRAANPGFEPVAAALSFSSGPWTSAVQLGQSLFLAGPAGLVEYAGGAEVHRWRTGMELPQAPIVGMAAGRLRLAPEPELFLATAGDGALILTPGTHPTLEQLLPRSPAQRDVSAVLATGTGDLLLGTRNAGLLLFSAGRLRAMPIAVADLDAARLGVTALASDGSSLLVGTRAHGAVLLHAGVALAVPPSSLPDADVESIAISGDHAFLGTPVGVAELALPDGRVTRTLAPGLFAHALAVDGGSLLVGTLDQGLREIPLAPAPRARLASFALHAAADAPRVDGLVPIPTGVLTLAGGHALLPGEAVPSAADEDAAKDTANLTDPNISALALAPDGELWVGLFDRGLDVLAAGTLRRVRHLEDDALFCLDRLAVDPVRRTMVAATANGLVLFDSAGTPRQTLTRRDGLIADHVNDVAFTPAGMALATPAGITFLNPSGPESLYAFEGLVNNHVYTLAASGDGRQLLAGTLGGLSLLEAEEVRQNVSATNSPLQHNWITAAIPEGGSAWLIGTYGAGLERVVLTGAGGVSIARVELPAGAPRDLVINPNALLSTPTAIYAGTLGHGLLVYSRASGRWSAITAGLPSLNVTAFAAGGGELFVGTENGLVRIAEVRLQGASR